MTLRILIADDEKAARFGMRKALDCEAYDLSEAEDGEQALERLASESFDLVFLDMTMPHVDGLAVLQRLPAACGPEWRKSLEVIVVTGDDRVESAVECLRLGASNYVAKPFEIEQIRSFARRTRERIRLVSQIDDLASDLKQRTSMGQLIGASQAMGRVFGLIERASRAEIDVLIEGETGTGKELIAREIHNQSSRSSGPFVAVNTAAIAESLTESELFGHAKGAFTGADAARAGVFEQADGGTLFLDEIGDMPTAAQAKILRVLQERVVCRIGDSTARQVDVRVISATHQDLEQGIAEKRFRQDLLFRIRGISIVAPPLRRRTDDVLPLAQHFLDSLVEQSKAPPTGTPCRFSPTACDRMLDYDWPGNVRQLKQAVTAAAALCDNGIIDSPDLQLPTSTPALDGEDAFADLLDLPLTEAKKILIESFERRMIENALAREEQNVSAAARRLGMHRQNLQQKIQQLGIQRATR